MSLPFSYDKLHFRWYQKIDGRPENFFFDQQATGRYHRALQIANPNDNTATTFNQYPLALETIFVQTAQPNLEGAFQDLGFTSRRDLVKVRQGYLLFGPALQTLRAQTLRNMLADDGIEKIVFHYFAL